MGKFQASSAVEALEFDFRPYVEAFGTIPEPSQGTINAFQAAVKSVVGKTRGLLDDMKTIQNKAPEELTTEDIDLITTKTEQTEELTSQMNKAITIILGGAVTEEQLSALPYRVSTAFVKWIFDELNPKTNPNGTKG